MKRSPMPRRTSPMRRGKGLSRTRSLDPTTSSRPRSAPVPRRPRRGRDEIPAEVREQVRARSGGRCEVVLDGLPGLSGRCTGRASQMHHRLTRARGGAHTAENLLDCCVECHIPRIHGNPEWAEERGYLLPTPPLPPVARAERPVAPPRPIGVLGVSSFDLRLLFELTDRGYWTPLVWLARALGVDVSVVRSALDRLDGLGLVAVAARGYARSLVERVR